MSKYLSEEDAKRKLGVSNFKQLSKEQTYQLVTMLPEMNPETATKLIEQFPEFSRLASTMVGYLKDSLNAILRENSDSSQHAFRAYQALLDDFSEQLKKPFLSAKDKRMLAEKMIEVADKIAAKDTENKNFFGKLYTNIAAVVGGVIFIAGAFLGVKFLGKK